MKGKCNQLGNQEKGGRIKGMAAPEMQTQGNNRQTPEVAELLNLCLHVLNLQRRRPARTSTLPLQSVCSPSAARFCYSKSLRNSNRHPSTAPPLPEACTRCSGPAPTRSFALRAGYFLPARASSLRRSRERGQLRSQNANREAKGTTGAEGREGDFRHLHLHRFP